MAVARSAGRRRLRLLLGLLAAVAACAAMLVVLHSPLMEDRHIVVSGDAHVGRGEVLAAAGLASPLPMIDVSPTSAVRGLDRLPWVKSASVSRQWPWTVRVQVLSRVPVGQVADRSGWALVDGSGRVLETSPAQMHGWITISGVPAGGAPASFLAAGAAPELQVARSLGARLRSVVSVIAAQPGGGVDLLLDGGARVRLGGIADLAEKLLALRTIYEQVDLSGIGTIDLSVPGAPTLTPASSHG